MDSAKAAVSLFKSAQQQMQQHKRALGRMRRRSDPKSRKLARLFRIALCNDLERVEKAVLEVRRHLLRKLQQNTGVATCDSDMMIRARLVLHRLDCDVLPAYRESLASLHGVAPVSEPRTHPYA